MMLIVCIVAALIEFKVCEKKFTRAMLPDLHMTMSTLIFISLIFPFCIWFMIIGANEEQLVAANGNSTNNWFECAWQTYKTAHEYINTTMDAWEQGKIDTVETQSIFWDNFKDMSYNSFDFQVYLVYAQGQYNYMMTTDYDKDTLDEMRKTEHDISSSVDYMFTCCSLVNLVVELAFYVAIAMFVVYICILRRSTQCQKE